MGMNFITAMTPAGKQSLQMLAYFVCNEELSDFISVQHMLGENCTKYNITADGDAYIICVVESEFSSIGLFQKACIELLQYSVSTPDILLCVLMFDGIYDGEESLIDMKYPEYIYGFASQKTGPVLCMDMNLLQSDAWKNLVSIVRM